VKKKKSAEQSSEQVSSDLPTMMGAQSGTRPAVQMRGSTPDLEGFAGPYQLLRVLGSGGVGTVYEARDPELERNVALKLMNVDAPSEWISFKEEARVTAQLEHPSIVPLYGMGVTETGHVYLVMRKVDGSSLSDVLADLAEGEDATRARWPRPRLLRAFLQVCEAASFAHSRGIIHRDLKPSNIMLGEFGETLVLDWGVARRYEDGMDPDDGSGMLVGTPGYMSPEQASGRPDLDPRSDVWSLGAILYELLTHEPAYRGNRPLSLLLRTMEGMPTPPPRRAPRMAIPKDLADICTRALATERGDRYQSAKELAEALQDFLEGTERQQKAEAILARAGEVWSTYLELGMTRDELREKEKRLADASDAWSPLSERRELLEVRDELETLEPTRARAFGEFVALCEKALAHAPNHGGARAALAGAYWERLGEAEERRDAAEIAYYHDRVSNFDDGSFTALLEGIGTLSLTTDPPDAEVICERFEKRGLIYRLDDRRELGKTPLSRVSLEMGSYLLTLTAEGREPVRYPVRIDRTEHRDLTKTPIRLLDAESIGEGFVYVPAGPFLYGGDSEAPGSLPPTEAWLDAFCISVFPVTMEEYTEFLNGLHEVDPAEAWQRCPRSESSLSVSEGQYFERPRRGGHYELPETGPDGAPWDPRWPVFGISWHDAVAYCAWVSERDGVSYRLPRERELEKAARGVDGRFYPWGDGFDRTLCKMGDSRRGPPRPEPVGAFPNDVSVYGVRDLGGSMRDWCGDLSFDGDTTLRPVRGGSWNYDPRFCRSATRLGRAPWRIFAYNGFRLAHDV
jgi:serine/threonine-protein kinase